MEKHPDSEALLKAIQDRAEQDRKQILAEGRAQVAAIKARADAAVEKINADAQAQAERAVARERERLLGRLKAEQRLGVLDTKRRLLQACFAQAEEEIERTVKSEAYREILSALIGEARQIAGPGAQVEVAPAEAALCQSVVKQQKLDCTVQPAQARPGTLRLRSADGHRCVDNGLHTRLDRARVHHQAEVARILFPRQSETAGEGA